MNKNSVIRCDLVKRKNPTFVIRLADGSSKSFTRHCDCGTAEKIKAEINNRIALGSFRLEDYFQARSFSIPLLKACQNYLTFRERQKDLGKISPATLEHDFYSLRILLSFAGQTAQVSGITIDSLDDLVLRLRKTKSKSGSTHSINSIRSHFKHLAGAFSWFVRQGWINKNPFAGYELPESETQKRILGEEEIRRISEYCEGLSGRWKADIFKLGILTGARRAELFGLKVGDLVFVNVYGLGEFPAMRVTGKGRKIRTIPLSPEALNILGDRARILSNQDQIDRLIEFAAPTMREKYLERLQAGYIFFEIASLGTISKEMKKVFRKVGIEDARFHDTRKTFATNQLENGVSMETVSSVLGHSDIRITQKAYATISERKIFGEIKTQDNHNLLPLNEGVANHAEKISNG